MTSTAQQRLTFDRAGTPLTAEIRPGHGTPALIVPGVMADAATWRTVAAGIDLPNPVAVLNRRGRTPSGPLGPDYSVDVEVEDLRHLLDVFGAVHLVGWSYGALIALEAAVGSDQVRSITAYEPVSRPFASDAVEPIRAAVAAGDLDRAVTLVNTDVSGFSEDYVADLRRGPVWPVLRQLAQPLGEELTAINGFQPSLPNYREIAVPVTLILGALNEGVAPYGSAFAPFAAALPQARLTRLPGQGHLAHVEAPDVLAAAITAAIRHAESKE
ncbi:alpha/beta fold hydrolase [Mycolicibacterium peregrinum]|uniref:Alpha/beta hydrolase n=1 Tax=Mycolicibacterium peregrinum TaxID=43304 RepID=A0A4Z0HS09_MYCPR|nr:alpha/beta hydrolase [Mycolicibacterium peregrinum]TGB40406.1 alpha/beta hydrolase [Mycolicibacterium peregrinum]TGB42866.1 alpha/beta hydrolase [Mycolicibacterium peregrinum]